MAMSFEQRERHLAVVVLIGSILSIVGSLYMISCFIFIKSLRTFRHQLILGLAICDLALALNFFAPSLSQITGNTATSPSNDTICSINGFITQLFFSQIDLWQITIAVTTLLLLSGPSGILKWAREHVHFVWLFPWAVSLVTALFGYGFWRYADNGSFCWLPTVHIRLYFNYLPRWLVILTCLAIYIIIFRIIRRARKIARLQRAYQSARGASSETEMGEGYKENMKGSSQSSLDSSRPHAAGAPGTAASEAPGLMQISPQDIEIEEQQKQIRRVAIQLISYPLAYAVLWTIPTVIMIYEVASGRKLNVHVEAMAKLLLVFNGFVDAHVYGKSKHSSPSSVVFIPPQLPPPLSLI
ncbi:hypothetical protein ABW19_dt0208051 [Dactylella cylindrospora]|nr:hypothetical protein ABW19_dt0208051 [Dactylella cylindrospora]